MGYRIYGESKPAESPKNDFLLGFLTCAIGIPMSFGWVFVSLGWLSNGTVWAVSAGVGVWFGGHLAYSSIQRIKASREFSSEELPASKTGTHFTRITLSANPLTNCNERKPTL